MSTYNIVETIEDGTKFLVAVPSTWENEGFLYWPSNKRSAYALRKKGSFPAPNWSEEKCIVKRDGIPSFSDALKIEKHMSKFSDTESEVEDHNKSKKRNHPALTSSQVFNYNTELGIALEKMQRMSGNVEKADVVVINGPQTSHSNTKMFSKGLSANPDCKDAETSDDETAVEDANLPDTGIGILISYRTVIPFLSKAVQEQQKRRKFGQK